MVSKSWMLVAAMAIGNACAQETVTTDTGANPAMGDIGVAVADVTTNAIDKPACTALCAGSAVELEIIEAITSARHKKGDHFALRLVTALTVGSDVYVPAGTIGVGEIIHASPSRAGGKPGELLLAARYLETSDGRRIPLRAMKLSARGKDHSTAAVTTAMVIGVLGMLVHGGEIVIPYGTQAMAKLGEDVDLSAPQPVGEERVATTSETAADSDVLPPTPHQPEVPTGTATQP